MKSFKHAACIPIILLSACVKQSQELPNQSNPGVKAEQAQTKVGAANSPSMNTDSNKEITTVSTGGKSVKASNPIPGSFELSGAMAARNSKKSFSAAVNWVQRGAGTYQIRLMGPIGSGTVMIEKQGGTVSFRDGAKKASSGNADELLRQHTGIRLPVSSLYYWVRGTPAPGAVQAEKRDAAHNLVSLRQGGYNIEYGNYKQAGSAVLPGMVRLSGNGVSIKLVVKHWKV